MKIAGIIAEYNPLHKGHAYLMEQAREQTGADYLVIVMSGDYVQRGEPAILDKHARARLALQAGADLVLELPVRYATASAQYFASGAIAVMNRLGCVDNLVFGSESCDIPLLTRMAKQLLAAEGDPSYQAMLKAREKAGDTYPAARHAALNTYLKERGCHNAPAPLGPNDILGVEYCKALLESGSSIVPCAVKRIGDAGHDSPRRSEEAYASAAALRQALQQGEDISNHLPEALDELWSKHAGELLCAEDFFPLLHYRLLCLAEGDTPVPYGEYADVSPELANRLEHLVYSMTGWEQSCHLLKTRDMTYARISRCLLHILLDLKKENTSAGRQEEPYPVFLSVLGFSGNALALLGEIKHSSQDILHTRRQEDRLLLPVQQLLLSENRRASHIYQSVVSCKYHKPFSDEYRRRIEPV